MDSATTTICLRLIGILNILTEVEPYAHTTLRIESVEIQQRPSPLVYKVERHSITVIRPDHGKTINRQSLNRCLQRLHSLIAPAQINARSHLELACILHELSLDPAVLAGPDACKVTVTARDEITGCITKALWHVMPGD